MAKHKRNKKARPKLQPVDSIPSNSSQDELFQDIVLTRARSEDALEKPTSTVEDESSSLQNSLDFVANNFQVSRSDDASVSSLKKAAAGSHASSLSGYTTEPANNLESERAKRPSTTADDDSGSVSSLQAAAASISPLTVPAVSSNPSGVHSFKSAFIQSAVNQPNSISSESNSPADASPATHSSPTENYASKYLPDLSPPCTPEGSDHQLKAPKCTLETKTPETTDSTNQEEESIEGMEQPLLESKSLTHDVHLDVEATPVVSNVSSGPAGPDRSRVNNKADMQTNTPQTRTKGGKKRAKRLQPRSTLFSPDHPNPKTPDEDLYDVFGFDLHKSDGNEDCIANFAENRRKGVEESIPLNLETAMDRAEARIKEGEQAETANPELSCRRSSSLSLTLATEASCGSKQTNLDPSKSCRRTSSVSFSENYESNTSLNTSTIHLIGSKSDESEKGQESDSESSFTSDEMSYFNESRASENHEHSTSFPRDSALPTLPQLPMRTHRPNTQHSSKGCNPIDMKLSLSISEEDDAMNQEELVLYQTYNPTKGDSFGSSIVESASESEEDEEEPTRAISSTSLTSGSDDAGVVSELSAYLMSSRIESLNDEKATSGRETPVGGGHAQSALRRKTSYDTPTPTNADGAKYIYDDVQSAIVDAKANSGAHKPTSSIDNSVCSALQQYNIKESPKLKKQMHSPGGAFNTTPQRKPNTNDAHPSAALDSLAYSVDREYHHDPSDETPFRQMKDEFDEEIAACSTIHEDNSQEVQSSRWGVLLCISMLNMMAGWTCFSVTPIASTINAFEDIVTEYLVSVFLLATCIGCFVEPKLRGRFGLRKSIAFGALLLMMGSLIKSTGAPIFDFGNEGDSSSCYAGFFTVGFSLPFYQNTISIIAKSWFHTRSENELASNIALNCYQIGIILSFVFGTLMVNSDDDIDDYFQLMSLLSVLAFVLVVFIVDDAPIHRLSRIDHINLDKNDQKQRRRNRRHKSKRNSSDFTPPEMKSEAKPLLLAHSLSPVSCQMSEQCEYGSVGTDQIASPPSLPNNNPLAFAPRTPSKHRNSKTQDQTWPLIKTLFSFSGFSRCTAAFCCAGVIMNTMLTFIGDLVKMNSEPKLDIWVIGGSLPFIAMVSTSLFGKFVKRSRKLYQVILSLLVFGSVSLLMCSLRLGVSLSLSICILIMGFLIGPLPFLTTVLGSRVVRPLEDKNVLIINRLASNGISAACIPIFNKLHHYSVAGGPELHDFTLSFYFLILVSVASAAYFSLFRSPALFYEEEFYGNSGARRHVNDNNLLWVPPGHVS